MIPPWKPAVLAVVSLAAVHLGIGYTAGPSLSVAMNVALFATNLYVLYCGRLLAARSGGALGLFFTGYFLLFALLIVLMDRKPLFILLVVVYASVFGSRFWLGLFGLFVLSFVVLQPYAFETFLPLLLAYLALWRLGRVPLFLRLALGVGLAGLAVLLVPLLHLVLQDSVQTLTHTAWRPDVQEAVWWSVASATVATAATAIWGVPLAYALARTDFAGKSAILTLVDVPILVPQSVVGIALVVMLGPGSALGQWLGNFGLGITGSLLGIVAAQIFVASPFLVKTALTAFTAVPLRLELASRTLGASPAQTFFRVALPLAGRGIAVGAILAWARAVSELGAILLFASTPLTAPVLVHVEFLRAGATESRPIATLLLFVCLWIFVLLQFGQSLLPGALGRADGRGPA